MLAWDVCPGEETIAAYVAGQLARAERDTLESHLDTCSSCQELVAALAKIQPPRDEHPTGTLGAASIEPGRELATWVPGGELGRYVLLARLGAGGMGVVYAAYDPELDRRVALKVLRRARAGEQLREEARAIARLAHPNVIAVHDVGEADGETFVAMEHVEGMTVRDWLRAPHPVTEIIDVFAQAGRGLAAAHAVGLVHRDVKPSNIIVGADGRARVLDFGLARAEPGLSETGHEKTIVGTPVYMAPEQRRGERIDARADQYAFCVALWEALAGARPEVPPGQLDGVSDRIERALCRGLSTDREARFATLDELLAEIAPPPLRSRRWMIATAVAGAALVATLAFTFTRDHAQPSCVRAGEPIANVWNDPKRAAVRAAFAATKLPYATTAADATIAQLDSFATRWHARATATCKATVVDRVQPAALHALRQGCLDQLVERLRPMVTDILVTPDAETVARGASVAAALPSPDRCDDIAALSALPPLPPAERDRAEVASLRATIATYEAALLAGRANQVREQILALRKRAEAVSYLPLRARSEHLYARLEISSAHYEQGIAALHAAARLATAARDLEMLADIWIELSQALGNDLRTLDEADLFDGYAEALIPQLPDREALALKLEFARCNRNAQARDAAVVAKHCQTAIDQGERTNPPRRAFVNAARARLGHFQRLQGLAAESLATLRTAVDEAMKFHGEDHPDTAIARYSLGIALIAQDQFDPGIAELRTALEIRRVAFPGGSIQVAESLQGLGDALASSGKHLEAITLLDEALATLDAIREAESAHAANSHILLGMSLEEVQRHDDALVHYLRAADVADRSLQRRETLAAMALRLAANIEATRDRAALGVTHLERAVRLLERGKAPPAELGQTQFRLSQFLFALGPRERERARAMGEAARASFVTAGPAGATSLAEVDKYLREQR